MSSFIQKILQLQATIPADYNFLSNGYLTVSNQTLLEYLKVVPDDVLPGKKSILSQLEINGIFLQWATHQESRPVGRIAFFIGRKVLINMLRRCVQKMQHQTKSNFSIFD